MGRSRHLAGFVAVTAACLFGVAGASFWGPFAAATVLVILALNFHEPVYARYAQTDNLGAQSLLLLGSIANAAVTVAAAYVAGAAIAWAWGV